MDIGSRSKWWFFFVLNLILEPAFGLHENNRFFESSDKPIRREEIKAVLEAKFLSILGLPFKQDKPKNKIKIPNHVWKLYYKWSDNTYHDLDKNNADTIQFHHHKEKPSIHHVNEQKYQENVEHLEFEINFLNECKQLHRAELHVFSEPHNDLRERKPYQVTIYSNDSTLPYIKKKISGSRVGFNTLEVTELVQKSMNNTPVLNIGITQNDRLHLRRRRNTDDNEWNTKRPVLVIYTLCGEKITKVEKSHHRSKREAIEKNPNSDNKQDLCHLHPFEFDLVKVGWNEFVLYPSLYRLNFCAGKCPNPLSHHFNGTNHAVIQNNVLKIAKDKVPPLCCIPSELEAQTIIYIDHENKMIIKRPDKMIATACGCR